MAIQQPISTDYLNSPDHSLSHRVIANDNAAPAEAIVVDSAGNVGIGTTAPGELLDVAGGNINLDNNKGIQWNGDSSKSIYFDSSGMRFYEGGFSMRLDASGASTRLVIGADNINAKGTLTVFGNATIGGTTFNSTEPPTDGLIVEGNVGIGTRTPTGVLHIKAGTASANTAPLKFTPGVLNTTPVVGCMEFVDNGTTGHLYITLNIGGVATRKEIAFV